MFLHVDRDQRRVRLLETILELEGVDTADGAEGADGERQEVVVISAGAARRFGIRPKG